MLLFKKEFIIPIIRGEKWQTRRLKKPRVRVGGVYACRVNRYRGEPFAFVKIKDIRRQRLSEITDDEVKAEGMRSREEFLEIFRNIYGISPHDDPIVWVIEFELVDANPKFMIGD